MILYANEVQSGYLLRGHGVLRRWGWRRTVRGQFIVGVMQVEVSKLEGAHSVAKIGEFFKKRRASGAIHYDSGYGTIRARPLEI